MNVLHKKSAAMLCTVSMPFEMAETSAWETLPALFLLKCCTACDEICVY